MDRHTLGGRSNKSYKTIHGRASIPDTRESSVNSSSKKPREKKSKGRSSLGGKSNPNYFFNRCSSKAIHRLPKNKDIVQITQPDCKNCQTPSKERRNNWHVQRELQLISIRDKRNVMQCIETEANEIPQKRLEELLRNKRQRKAKTHIPIATETKETKQEKKIQGIEHYSVGKMIGQGGYAIVRKAVHRISHVKVAIKSYDKQSLLEPNLRKCVEREISILNKLQHPNIVQIYDTIDTNTHLHIVMERLSGTSLYTMLKQKQRLNSGEAREIFKQLLSALSYCHSKEVVHRDIKLENIIVDQNNNLKLIDFGFSTQLPRGSKSKVFCGTPSYMAPEIITNNEYSGEPVDVWACCVLLFALLSGEFPFKANSENELFKNIRTCRIQWPESIPEHAKSFIVKGLTHDPNARATVNELLQDKWLSCTDRLSLLAPPDSNTWALSTAGETFDHSDRSVIFR